MPTLPDARPGRRRRSRLFGVTLASDFDFAAHDVLRFCRGVDFSLRRDEIFCHLRGPEDRRLVEIRLLGPVLSFWLERRGVPALHASAVVVGGRAVAFLAENQGGKTALAAALVRRGHALLTDDVLAVEASGGGFSGQPGYPQMRMWPDEAAHFCRRPDDLDTVHPSVAKLRVPISATDFCRSPRPLAAIYLAARRELAGGPDGEIHPLASRDAVIELVRHSFTPHLVAAAGLQPARLELFARLATRVPVRRLVYRDGFERLPAVAERIVGDLQRLREAAGS